MIDITPQTIRDFLVEQGADKIWNLAHPQQ